MQDIQLLWPLQVRCIQNQEAHVVLYRATYILQLLFCHQVMSCYVRIVAILMQIIKDNFTAQTYTDVQWTTVNCCPVYQIPLALKNNVMFFLHQTSHIKYMNEASSTQQRLPICMD